MPQKVKETFEILTKALKEVTDKTDQMYCTGGFVRDLLLGVEFMDIDMTIQEEFFEEYVKRLKVLPSVIGFGTDLTAGLETMNQIQLVRFVLNGFDFDLKRSNFGSNIKKDVLLRDFTINALYINPCTFEIIDPDNYLDDLKSKTLRGIQKYSLIFIDRNRIIRAVRFKSKGYSFETELESYMKKGAKQYMKSAGDILDLQRFGGEIRKCIQSSNYLSILTELITGDLLSFMCKDKKVLMGMLDTIVLVKDLFLTPYFEKTASTDKDELETFKLMLILQSIIIFFLNQYEIKEVKKSVVRKVCMIFLRKSKIEETLELHEKMKSIAAASSIDKMVERLKSFKSEESQDDKNCQRLLLLSLYIDFEDFMKLIH